MALSWGLKPFSLCEIMYDSNADRWGNLSRDDFAEAIAKGLGRALICVRERGLDNFKDLVLAACLKDLTYDPQCEGSRAKWLFSMFADSEYYPEFRDKILAALAVEDETWDLLQLCQLAKEMAIAGDNLAGQKLADRVYGYATKRSSDDWMGADEVIELYGMDAAIELSRIYGRRLLADPQDWVPDTLSFFSNMSAPELEIFDRFAREDELVSAYKQYLIDRQVSEVERQATRKKEPPERISIERVIEFARQKKYEYPSIYMGFGRRATGTQLEAIFDLLLHESDEEVFLRLLWVFWRVPLPRLDDRILILVDSNNDRLKESVIPIIAQTSDDRVYQIARSKVENLELTGADSEALDLFINNYRSGDAKIIRAALNNAVLDRDDLHAISTSIIDLSKKQNSPELVTLLEWMFDRTPCSYCRKSIVAELGKYQQVSDRILAEYQFDAIQFDRYDRDRGIGED